MKSNTPCHAPLERPLTALILTVLATCSWTEVTLAQDAAAPSSSPVADAASAPATDAAGSATPSGAANSTVPSGTDKPSSPFRTGEASGTGASSKKSPFAYDVGDTDSPRKSRTRKADNPEPDKDQPVAPAGGDEEGGTTIVAPNLYGHGPQIITPGRGVYARPKFRYGISVGIGFDDNPNQTPTVNLNAVASPRTRTGFNYINGHFDAQWLKPRTVFTITTELGGDYYWSRPGGNTDFNGRLAMLYVDKINPRTQFTANASFAYLSMPDYSNLYASNNQAGGDYFTGSTKFDLSYRWAPQFSTLTSVSVNLLKFANDSVATQSNSYFAFIFGNEFRFQSSPRLTWVAEGRYEIDDFLSNTALNSQTAYGLGGFDWQATRHLTTTLRVGASFRNFSAGGNNSAPYAEATLNYLVGRHSTLSFNGRYGFEQSNVAGDDNKSIRLGLVYQQAFTTRFSGNVGFNYIHTDYSPRTGAGSSVDVYDLSLGVQYRFDRHFLIGARYNYTLQGSSTGLQDFDRNRFLFTASYEY